MNASIEIPDDRPLAIDERTLTTWLLEHGTPDARDYLVQLSQARVVSRCACGCASINFDVVNHFIAPQAGMNILADYQWRDADGHVGGVFVFAKNAVLAGLEVWSIDGIAAIDRLPKQESLEPLDGSTRNSG